MKTLEQKIEVMQAALDGKEIEFNYLETEDQVEWVTVSRPDFNWKEFDYRIKPEPMEFWVGSYPDGTFRLHMTEKDANTFCEGVIKIIKVREVLDE